MTRREHRSEAALNAALVEGSKSLSGASGCLRWASAQRVFCICILTLLLVLPNANALAQAPTPPTPVQDQCKGLSRELLIGSAQRAVRPARLVGGPKILPGGAVAILEIGADFEQGGYCTRLLDSQHEYPMSVLAATRLETAILGVETPEKRTALRVLVPSAVGLRPPKHMEFLLVSFRLDSAGQLVTDAPQLSVQQRLSVSNGRFSAFLAIVAVIVAYAIGALAVGMLRPVFKKPVLKPLRIPYLSPVFVTSGVYGTANLSQLQVFGFTLLVLGVLAFVLARTGVLSDISADLLILMGISAGGAASAKGVEVLKRRVSFENWAWLRTKGWLTAPEAGTGQHPAPTSARWKDLLKTDGSFDVYKFQLLFFSLLVAVDLLMGDVAALARFDIPPNLLALLGVSNVVYLGGTLAGPPSFDELDKKLDDLRKAEVDWKAKVVPAVQALPDQAARRAQANAKAPAESQRYLSAAREAATMVKSLFGAAGTAINDDNLLPTF